MTPPSSPAPAQISYARSPYPVSLALEAAHSRFWRRLAAPGAWLSGAERVAVAREVRRGRDCDLCRRRKQSLSPYFVDGAHDRDSDLSSVAVDAVHRLVTDASRLKREWLEQSLAAGLTVERYVEILGTVVALISIDSFCLALGLDRACAARTDCRRAQPLSTGERAAGGGLGAGGSRGQRGHSRSGPLAGRSDRVGDPRHESRARRGAHVGGLSEVHYLGMKDVPNPQASRGSI